MWSFLISGLQTLGRKKSVICNQRRTADLKSGCCRTTEGTLKKYLAHPPRTVYLETTLAISLAVWWIKGVAMGDGLCAQNEWGTTILKFAYENHTKVIKRTAVFNNIWISFLSATSLKHMRFLTLECFHCGFLFCCEVLHFDKNFQTFFHCYHWWMTSSRVPEVQERMNESYLCLPGQIVCTLCCTVAPVQL